MEYFIYSEAEEGSSSLTEECISLGDQHPMDTKSTADEPWKQDDNTLY